MKYNEGPGLTQDACKLCESLGLEVTFAAAHEDAVDVEEEDSHPRPRFERGIRFNKTVMSREL